RRPPARTPRSQASLLDTARPTVDVGLVADHGDRAGRRVRPVRRGLGGLDLVLLAGLATPPLRERLAVEAAGKRLARPLEGEHHRVLLVELDPYPGAAGQPHVRAAIVLGALGENVVKSLRGPGARLGSRERKPHAYHVLLLGVTSRADPAGRPAGTPS